MYNGYKLKTYLFSRYYFKTRQVYNVTSYLIHRSNFFSLQILFVKKRKNQWKENKNYWVVKLLIKKNLQKKILGNEEKWKKILVRMQFTWKKIGVNQNYGCTLRLRKYFHLNKSSLNMLHQLINRNQKKITLPFSVLCWKQFFLKHRKLDKTMLTKCTSLFQL